MNVSECSYNSVSYDMHFFMFLLMSSSNGNILSNLRSSTVRFWRKPRIWRPMPVWPPQGLSLPTSAKLLIWCTLKSLPSKEPRYITPYPKHYNTILLFFLDALFYKLARSNFFNSKSSHNGWGTPTRLLGVLVYYPLVLGPASSTLVYADFLS